MRRNLQTLAVTFGCWVAAGVMGAGGALPELQMMLPAGYLPGVPWLARAELRRADGAVAREHWDAEVTLSSSTPGVLLSTNRIHLYNGVGSAPVAVSYDGDFELVAEMDGQRVSSTMTSLANVPVTSVAGTLAGPEAVWSGVVRVTGDVVVAAPNVLTVQPGTWVVFEGSASGANSTDLEVRGQIRALGTADQPVVFTVSSTPLTWGEIRHLTGSSGTYRHVTLMKGGRSAAGGHTGSGPMVRMTGCTNTFLNCSLTDTTAGENTMGKILSATGSELSFSHCLLSRSLMGPEIEGTGLSCVDTFILDMVGSAAAPQGTNDNDGIYLHSAGGGKTILLRGCVIAHAEDDGIDTLGSTVAVEDCWIRNCDNRNEDAKGISVFSGETQVRSSLIVDCTVGVSAKAGAPPDRVRVTLEHCTLTQNHTNAWANKKSNAPGPDVHFDITNSVLWGGVRCVASDFEPQVQTPSQFALGYSDVSQSWTNGTGNQTNAVPGFADEAGHDFRLLPTSPCIDRGDPESPADPDGSRADLGCLAFVPPAPTLLGAKVEAGAFGFQLSAYPERNYVLQTSSNAVVWADGGLIWATNTLMWVEDPEGSGGTCRFYRARLAP